MSIDTRPLMLAHFNCKRCKSHTLTVKVADRSATGVNEVIIICNQCDEKFCVRWVDEQPSKFIIAKRWTKTNSAGRKGRYVQWVSHEIPAS